MQISERNRMQNTVRVRRTQTQHILRLDAIYFREHLNEKHDLNLSAHNKIYKCTFCDEFFDRKSSLLMHKKTAHPGQTNYMCDDCGKKCHTPSELSIHRRMHTGKHCVPSVFCPNVGLGKGRF